jgi:glycosyltransferase involved in cell wall biosynthesis
MTPLFKADILLLLEGTYPYIRGGVSSWIHQLIRGLPSLTFELVFIGGNASQYGSIQYELPDNVTGLQVYYLTNNLLSKQSSGHSAQLADTTLFTQWQDLLHHFHDTEQPIPPSLLTFAFQALGHARGLRHGDFLSTQHSWQILTDHYSGYSQSTSFLDFFWTFRNIYGPLFHIAEIARELPKVRLIHSISTGYAGFLGAGASLLHQTPLLITEHGIYTKERKIDLIQADWIHDKDSDSGLQTEINTVRSMWISFFEQLGKSSYQQARKITALYEGNRQRQIRDGAPEQNTLVIPNGIQIQRFTQALQDRPGHIPKVAGLIGRVVPIKDIKTFIRAIKEARAVLPDIEGWVVGPTEEDQAYFQECQLLVTSLELDGIVRFLGMQDVTRIFPQLGLVALTSISEAQPLVLLEAMAAGVPALATDVGACREIIEGLTPDDRDLGKAGEIVPIASSGETAHAMIKILEDPAAWQQYQQAGLQRVQRFYDESLMFERYHRLYREYQL